MPAVWFVCHSIKNLLHCKSMFCVSGGSGKAWRAVDVVHIGVNDNKYAAPLTKQREKRAEAKHSVLKIITFVQNYNS